MERFNHWKQSELEVRKQYQIKISKRFCSFGELNDSKDLNRARKNIKQNIITSVKDSQGLYEIKRHKPGFDEGCLRLLHQREEAKI